MRDRVRVLTVRREGRAQPAGVLRALEPGITYLGVRALGLLVLAAFARVHGTDLAGELRSWDGNWLLSLAQYGYDGLPPGQFGDAHGGFSAETPYGFFPGYPLAVALLGHLGIPLFAAGLVVTYVAGVATAYGLVRLVGALPGGSRRAGVVLVALFAASPLAVVLSMTYTEALFCALAVWALVFLQEERWLLAGFLTALAGIVRPTAVALVAALCVALLMTARRNPATLGAPLAGTALGTAGVLGWQLAVWLRTGAPGGWSGIQARGWGWGFDGGVRSAEWGADVLLEGTSVFELAVVATVVAALVLLGVAVHAAVRGRLPWPQVAYAATVVVVTVGAYGLMFTKARFLLPAFVLLVPPAVALARRGTATVAGVVSVAALGSAWLGAVALTVWTTAI